MKHGRTNRAGFTLIEILAVILIVGILSTILIVNMTEASDASKSSMTRQDLIMLEGVIESYEDEYGDYPKSWFDPDEGVPNDGTNIGIEALVQALWSKNWEAGGLIEPDKLQNTDGDSSPQTLGDLGRDLLEFVDRWDNPIAYIHRQDYEVKDRMYLTWDPATGEEILSSPRAYENPTTKRFYKHTKFQLISAGSDGQFGTEDDITPFDR